MATLNNSYSVVSINLWYYTIYVSIKEFIMINIEGLKYTNTKRKDYKDCWINTLNDRDYRQGNMEYFSRHVSKITDGLLSSNKYVAIFLHFPNRKNNRYKICITDIHDFKQKYPLYYHIAYHKTKFYYHE